MDGQPIVAPSLTNRALAIERAVGERYTATCRSRSAASERCRDHCLGAGSGDHHIDTARRSKFERYAIAHCGQLTRAVNQRTRNPAGLHLGLMSGTSMDAIDAPLPRAAQVH